MASRDESATSRRRDVVQPEAAAGPRASQNSPVADEAHRERVRPRSRPGSVDVAASLAVPHAAVPAQTPADDSVPARAVWELLAVAHRHNWRWALVAAARFVQADAEQHAPVIAFARTSKLEHSGGRRNVDELLSVTVVPNSLWDMGSQVANRLAANVAAATFRPAVDSSGTPDTLAESDEVRRDAALAAAEDPRGSASDASL